MFKRWLLLILLFPLPLWAMDFNFVAGKDYEIITTNNAPIDNKKINVLEFFSYGCPWCYRIEPGINQWVKQQGNAVDFVRVPVVFNKDWVYYAKAYYTAELLNLSTKLNPLLFKAIQIDKKNLSSNQAMIDFFIAEGVSKDMAESAFTHSTTIDMKINEGNVAMGQFHVNAVPAFVVNNKYKTDLQMATSEERLLQILNHLIDLSKK